MTRKFAPRTARAVLEGRFKVGVDERAADVDPGNDLDWFALTMGWALANGLTPAAARAFAIYIRYETDLG